MSVYGNLLIIIIMDFFNKKKKKICSLEKRKQTVHSPPPVRHTMLFTPLASCSNTMLHALMQANTSPLPFIPAFLKFKLRLSLCGAHSESKTEENLGLGALWSSIRAGNGSL